MVVDLLDRLPAPFGLVRYGVAPDHPKMRGLSTTLQKTLDHPRVRFVGNVGIGETISVEELRESYDAVLYTFGAAGDRRLGIEGEELPGSLAAVEVVSWYCGWPDADRERVEDALRRARDVVVIGVGNVALDVARVLARTSEELEPTVMPRHVMDTLANAPVRRITVLGRRGPEAATFTTPELRELGTVRDVRVRVDEEDLPEVEGDDLLGKVAARNLAVLREWTANSEDQAAHGVEVQLRFHRRPLRILGEEQVEGVEVQSTRNTSEETEIIPADLVVRAIGYRGQGLPGLPVRAGVVENQDGRVLRDGHVSPGEYVAGWIKRGPTGVVGTNKKDARETVAVLLADAETGRLPAGRERRDLVELVRSRGAHPVLLTHWKAIDALEVALGQAEGRERLTVHEWGDLLAAGSNEISGENLQRPSTTS